MDIVDWVSWSFFFRLQVIEISVIYFFFCSLTHRVKSKEPKASLLEKFRVSPSSRCFCLRITRKRRRRKTSSLPFFCPFNFFFEGINEFSLFHSPPFISSNITRYLSSPHPWKVSFGSLSIENSSGLDCRCLRTSATIS